MMDPSVHPVLITGLRKQGVRIRIIASALRVATSVFGDPLKAVRSLYQLFSKRKRIHGRRFLPKYVRANGKYYSALNIPGWPSPAFDDFIRREMIRTLDPEGISAGLHTLIFSITARCRLHCEHCYEWDNIQSAEILTSGQLERILEKIHSFGVSHVQFSGGEPVVRHHDLTELMKLRQERTDYWILTSGYELTREVALGMRESGIAGAVVSVDHWDEKAHNVFRKDPRSYAWARDAVQNCNEAGLLTALSLCASRSMVSMEDLMKYAEMAREWRVGFIRLLEPREVGRYKGSKVHLRPAEKDILDEFYLQMNTKRRFIDYPIVMYPGFHQRRVGCLGAGNRYAYIDSKGELHACPFCQDPLGNVLEEEFSDLIMKARAKGCGMFKTSREA